MVKIYRIDSSALDEPWEGPFDELIESNEDMPELVQRRVEGLKVGEKLNLDYRNDAFSVERVA